MEMLHGVLRVRTEQGPCMLCLSCSSERSLCPDSLEEQVAGECEWPAVLPSAL